MKIFISPGHVLPFVAPSGDVVSGGVYVIGGLVVVALDAAAEGDTFQGYVTGAFTLAKKTSQVWAAGDKLYWDPTPGEFTTAVTETNVFAGFAAGPAASADATGPVLLVNVGSVAVGANVAALGAPAAVTGVDGAGSNAASKADVDTRLTAIHAKIDAIIGVLVTQTQIQAP